MALDPVTAGIDAVTTFVNKIWPDKTQVEKDQLAAAIQLVSAQTDINKVEASSGSTFVAGGRPFCIWVGGFALAYASILEPLLRFVASVGFGYHGVFPVLDTTVTTQVLMGLLGLGAMRSVDKFNGVASK